MASCAAVDYRRLVLAVLYPGFLLGDLYPLLALLFVAAVVYALREAHRRRTEVRPQMPEITMTEVWQIWERGEQAPPHLRAVLERDLLETESRCLASGNPRLALRTAILESASAALHLEAISGYGEAERQALLTGYAAGMEQALRNALAFTTLKRTVLRDYARLKYDDASPRDWFDHFMEVARPYVREKVRLARDAVFEMDESAGRFVARYDALLEELGETVLKAPPKKRFVPVDLQPS